MAKSVPRPESWLATLPTELSHRLFAKARPLSLAASQTLFVAGDDGDGWYRVEEGLFKASVSVATGSERILAILGPGSVVGELSMIDSAPRSASVSALRDSKLSFVDCAAFETFAQSTPELYRHITTLLARRLRDTNEALVATNFLSVMGRVARALLSLAEAFGRDIGQGRVLIRQKVSHTDVGAMAGIGRENVSRVLNDWANRSLVSRLAATIASTRPPSTVKPRGETAFVRKPAARHLWPRPVAAGLLLSANASGDISLATHQSLREWSSA